jgi:hypothetical protein
MTLYKRCRNSFRVSTCSLENDVPVKVADSHSKHIDSHDPNDESLVSLVFCGLKPIVTL